VVYNADVNADKTVTLTLTICLVSNITFPFIRSNWIEFYFSVPVRYTVRKRQRCYGTAVHTRITETDTDKRKRNVGDKANP